MDEDGSLCLYNLTFYYLLIAAGTWNSIGLFLVLLPDRFIKSTGIVIEN